MTNGGGGEFPNAVGKKRRAKLSCIHLCIGGAAGLYPVMMQQIHRFLMCLAVLVLAGCSSYEKRFAAAAARVPEKGDRFSGAYSGEWKSTSHPGADGRLWCILERRKDGTHHADFKATWHGVFSSEHSVVLQPGKAKPGGAQAFSGTSVIKMFIGSGTYSCEGTMDGTRVRADYDATYDRGSLDVKRVAR